MRHSANLLAVVSVSLIAASPSWASITGVFFDQQSESNAVYVDSTGDLTLNDATVTNGFSVNGGGLGPAIAR